MLPESEMECFLGMSLGREDHISQAFTIGQLSEHEDRKLVVACKLLDIFVTIISPCEIVESVAIKEV